MLDAITFAIVALSALYLARQHGRKEKASNCTSSGGCGGCNGCAATKQLLKEFQA